MNLLANRPDRNAFASIKFGSCFIERCEQSCLFRNIALNLLTKPNQFADLANLFFEWQLREPLAHFGFHSFGSFNLCRRKISSNSVLSIFACAMSCSMRAKSL